MSGETVDGLELLLAEREIRRRLADYCSGIDRRDEALVASAFHLESRVIVGHFDGSGREFAARTVPMLVARTHLTVHRMGEPRIDHVADGVAEVETPIFAQHVVDAPGIGGGDGHRAMPAGRPFLECFAGWYLDRFERRDGAWRIAERTLLHGWDTLLPIHEAFALGGFPSGLPQK